ncbi:AAA family ATPase [Pseudonocardia petroleophila]|uniref:AAA family ATPase n=1 Tax=Pseudonocardia petroleophila TaxID=37331 RepID=UPI002103E6E9|nr:AAA family ATPase [Pseudonocardia petroleophila]
MPGRFVRYVALDEDAAGTGYPFDLPVVDGLRRAWLTLGPGVTFLVGENGSGKSTLVEGIAVAAGFNAEGGSRSFRFATRSSESSLGRALRVGRAPGRERTSFFLRAESYYNVATELENIGGGVLDGYGGVSPHDRSHGESFLDLLTHRFHPRGLYLLDEPEAALSTRGCIRALRRIDELVRGGSQFLVATHSPVLLAVPGARILEIGDDGSLTPVRYDDALPVRTTRAFLADPGRHV